MQARFRRRIESAQRRFYVVLLGAGERRYARLLEFSCHGLGSPLDRRARQWRARFDDVRAKLLNLAGELQLFLAVHRKTGGLFAVAQRRIENLRSDP